MQADAISHGQPETLPFGRFWTFEETAQYLFVDESTLRDLMQKRLILYHQWGQIIRFVPEEVLAPQQGVSQYKRMPGTQQGKRRTKQHDNSAIMTTEEVADLCRIDPDSVKRLGLPEMPRKPGGKHRYIRSGVMRWLEEQSNGKAG